MSWDDEQRMRLDEIMARKTNDSSSRHQALVEELYELEKQFERIKAQQEQEREAREAQELEEGIAYVKRSLGVIE